MVMEIGSPSVAWRALKKMADETEDDAHDRAKREFKTSGDGIDGSTSCWGDVGAGDAEADVFHIPFIVSVQYIGY